MTIKYLKSLETFLVKSSNKIENGNILVMGNRIYFKLKVN